MVDLLLWINLSSIKAVGCSDWRKTEEIAEAKVYGNLQELIDLSKEAVVKETEAADKFEPEEKWLTVLQKQIKW